MSDNPFASYDIEVPKKYADDIKRFCKTAGGEDTYEFPPFTRQVDLWYFAFIYAVKKELDPAVDKEKSNITPATILSIDNYRISHILLAYLGATGAIEELANYRKAFDYDFFMANAGFPHVLQILKDPDKRPLWSILGEIEAVA
jgi:hypothetical protein